MDVLCTDKTGTLTEDRIELVRHVNIDMVEDERVLRLAFMNSHFQTGLKNPMDSAVLQHDSEIGTQGISKVKKIDEIPFDFMRRRMSVVVQDGREHVMITKGSPESVFPICNRYHHKGKPGKFSPKEKEKAKKLYDLLSMDGFRVLALASRRAPAGDHLYKVADEADLTFEGFLAFLDPPKQSAHSSLAELMKRGVEVKILSGDNELVNKKIAQVVGLNVKGVITGDEIAQASDDSLNVLAEKNTIFARVSPCRRSASSSPSRGTSTWSGSLATG